MSSGGDDRRPVLPRFIAGAVCPDCAAQDTIALFREARGDRIECVDCGHEELRPAESAGQPEASGSNVVALRFVPRSGAVSAAEGADTDE